MDQQVNARSLPREAVPAILPVFSPGVPQGIFGWEGTCVDTAISLDNPEAMQFCHDHGFIDHTTTLLYGDKLRAYCEQMVRDSSGREGARAPNVARLLKRLGYPN